MIVNVLKDAFVRHVNSSVIDPRGYRYTRCADFNLATLQLGGNPVFTTDAELDAYVDATIKYYSEYTLQKGSCQAAGFIYPPRNCVVNPSPWDECTVGNRTNDPNIAMGTVPWPFPGDPCNRNDGKANPMRGICALKCGCDSCSRIGKPCTETNGICAACNPKLPGNALQQVRFACEDVGCVFGNYCGSYMYELCGAARNTSQGECTACIIANAAKLNNDECFSDNEYDFCNAQPPYCYNTSYGQRCH